MNNFTYFNSTKIIFGRECESQVGAEISNYSKKILLHYGGGSIKKNGLYDKVISNLKEAGIEYIELPGVKPNPRLSLVREGIKLCRDNNINFILAVGGGSVIDSAKAIAIGVPYCGDVWDFYTGKATTKEAISIGTILTFPAAGSEASMGSVITNEENWNKKDYSDKLMYPKFSILNPENAFTLPKYQIACGASDIMAHLMERYFTNVLNVELSDRLIEATLKTVIDKVPVVLEQPDNYDAWAELMWAGKIAQNNLFNSGRSGDWSCHVIEHDLSGIYDIAHGAGLAILFPVWMKYVVHHDIKRFAQFASKVWDVEYSFWQPEKTALEGIRRLKEFYKFIGLPTTLEELNIGDDRLDEIAARCTQSGKATLGGFFPLQQKDVSQILKMAVPK